MDPTDVNKYLDASGIRLAGWLITGTILAVGAAFLYIKFLEYRKLRIDYRISKYDLHVREQENPGFTP